MVVDRKHLDLNGQIVFDQIRFKLPLNVKGDMRQEACLFLSLDAEGKLYTCNGSEEIVAEDAILMKCGNYVRHLTSSRIENETQEIFLIHFFPGLFESEYKDELPEFFTYSSTIENKTYTEKFPLTYLLESYVKSIYFYFDHPSLVTDELLMLKLKELVILLVSSDSSGKVKEFFQTFLSPVEYDFKKTISAHLYEDISLDELAFLCNLSLSSFQRKFKETYNDSPAHYFKLKRLEKAAVLLKTEKLSISDVCYQSGFSAPNYFAKVFKAHYGVSPSQYKRCAP